MPRRLDHERLASSRSAWRPRRAMPRASASTGSAISSGPSSRLRRPGERNAWSRRVGEPLPESLRSVGAASAADDLLVLPLGEVRILERFVDDAVAREARRRVRRGAPPASGVGTERGQGEHQGVRLVAGVDEQRLNERAVLEVERPAELLGQRGREQRPSLRLSLLPPEIERLPPRGERVVDHL